MKDLRTKVIAGLSWRSGVEVFEQVLLLGFTAVLARLLTPEDFGLVAMSLLVIRLVTMLTQVGFGSAMIQNQNMSEKLYSGVFIIQIGIHAAIFLVCILLASPSAIFFNQPTLAQLIQTLATLVILNALMFPAILMQKRLEISKISLCQVVSLILGNIIGILLALKGFGVWSLVFREIGYRALNVLLIWFVSNWRPTRPEFKGSMQLFVFGLSLLGSKASHFVTNNLVAFLFGKTMSASTLGAYSIAYNLAVVPAEKIKAVFGSILFPALSAIQSEEERYHKVFTTSLFLVAAVFCPAMFGLAAVSNEIVLVLFGDQWAETPAYLEILSFAGLAMGLNSIIVTSINSLGMAKENFRVDLAGLLLSVTLVPMGYLQYGEIGAIMGYLFAVTIALLLRIFLSKRSQLGLIGFVSAAGKPLVCSALMYAVLFSFSIDTELVFIQLAVKIMLGMTCYLILFWLILNRNQRAIILNLPLVNKVALKVGARISH